MKFLRNSLLFLCVVLHCLSTKAYAAKFVPEDDKVLVVIGQDKDTIETYIREVEIVPGGVMVYTSLQEVDGLSEPAQDRGAGVHHAQYLMNKYPNVTIQLGLYMVGILDEVLSGEYDANIQRLGDWMKQAKRPIYLRIGYEFDFPDNNYNPQKYTKAFRCIVDKLRAQQVDNVDYVWHSHGYIYASKPFMDWYPGDAYVDWFAISFMSPYNQGNMDFITNRAKDRNKPLMIAEATPYQIGVEGGQASWKKWYERFFRFIEEQDVKIISYINSDWESMPMFKGQEWGDARIQQNAFIKEQWMNEMQAEKYLHASQELFSSLKRDD